jgi:heme/copper-type cytochrome/quinol oxidase subunit 4
MSCCGNHNHGSQQNEQQGHQHQHGGGKHNSHKWMMILCCVLPIVFVAILFLTNTATGSVGSALPLLLVLLCPLSHLILMPLMMKKKKNQHT